MNVRWIVEALLEVSQRAVRDLPICPSAQR
jgi:hypothetical protein